MNLNLLLNIEDFRWPNISVDRSSCLENFAELLEILSDEEDESWQHPDIYTLCYPWGCVHDFIYSHDFLTAQSLTGGWMQHKHYQTLKNIWKRCKNQNDPLCRTLAELNGSAEFGNRLNGVLACSNTTRYFVNSITSRFDLQILYCSRKNELINWEKNNHFFLPNVEYSNLYLAERANTKFDTDLKEKKKQIAIGSKYYCDSGYKTDTKNGSKEANADQVGSEVARRNFYQFERELTQAEEKLRHHSLRKIFSLTKDQNKIFISIDFEKGYCFEVCNEKGKHIGEFRFDGIENGKDGSTEDASGNHDIWALTKN